MTTVQKIEMIKARVIERTLGKPESPKGGKKDKPRDVFKESLESVFEKADFGCQTAHVKRLMEVLASEIRGEKIDIEVKKSSKDSPAGTWNFLAVVPLKNSNGHNYPIGKPCLLGPGSNTQAMNIMGTVGNNLPYSGYGVYPNEEVRLATAKEIDNFFTVVGIMESEKEIIKFFGDSLSYTAKKEK